VGNDGSRTNNPSGSIRVGKVWTKIEGRDFLIEFINYKTIEPHLKTLPRLEAKAPENKAVATARLNQGADKRKLPTVREARAPTPINEASGAENKPGLLIDYETSIGSSNFTFKGDTTYYVSGQVYIYGTITIEGGTVVKFKPYLPEGNWLEIHAMDGLFNCKTDAYRPGIFTSRDDNSVGETISGSTGVPSGYLGCFNLESGQPALSNLRICYASWPTSFQSDSSGGDLSNIQYVNCAIPINSEEKAIRLRNVLNFRRKRYD
jgi:hypothetical protein